MVIDFLTKISSRIIWTSRKRKTYKLIPVDTTTSPELFDLILREFNLLP